MNSARQTIYLELSRFIHSKRGNQCWLWGQIFLKIFIWQVYLFISKLYHTEKILENPKLSLIYLFFVSNIFEQIRKREVYEIFLANLVNIWPFDLSNFVFFILPPQKNILNFSKIFLITQQFFINYWKFEIRPPFRNLKKMCKIWCQVR